MSYLGRVIYVKYIAPRKRKSVYKSFCGKTDEECLQKAKQFLKENLGKYIDAHFRDCVIEEYRGGNSFTFGFFDPYTKVSEQMLQELNTI